MLHAVCADWPIFAYSVPRSIENRKGISNIQSSIFVGAFLGKILVHEAKKINEGKCAYYSFCGIVFVYAHKGL